MNTQANTANEYDQQATDFLAKHGLKMRITLSDSKTAPWAKEGEETGHHYRVTISKAERATFEALFQYGDRTKPTCLGTFTTEKLAHKANENRLDELTQEYAATCGHSIRKHVYRKPARLVFDFWGSVADAEAGITEERPYSVLACISGDAYTPETFADFCAEYGYEEDSIKALQTFRRCDKFAKRLRAFFTEAELSDLSEIR